MKYKKELIQENVHLIFLELIFLKVQPLRHEATKEKYEVNDLH